MSKYIFVTGGVISGLGKGVSAASVGNLLKSRGFSVFVLKLDPYLNIDPGTMSPYEHGEVYVTEDGGETDLDLGHYERFIDQNFSKDSNVTSGKIFQNILNKERKGFYNGKTVQFIPHVTDEIILSIKNIEEKYKTDFIIIEIGGTVGDIESNSFMHAISELSYDSEENKTFFIHVTYVPYLTSSGEFKTKPTQFSVANLKGLGIEPNMLFLRSDDKINNEIIAKVAKSSRLRKENVITVPNISNIYEMPLYLETQKVVQNILNYFNIKDNGANLHEWEEFVNKAKKINQKTLNIAMIGKYTEFSDAYKSINEALKISSIHLGLNLNLKYFDSSLFTEQNIGECLKNYDGVVILPGFGARGFEGKVLVATYTRKHNIPTFGICLGMQAMTVAQARIKGLKNATSKEFASNKDKEIYVLDYIQGKTENDDMGGTLRLGASQTVFKENSLIASFYETNSVYERHRHRYEVNNEYINILQDDNFIFSGIEPNLNLIESCEDISKEFYIGVQYHPEFTARPLKPHKLFNVFLKAASKQNGK
ncbi:CTP synthase [Mycoplasma leonicaptivi]|uniref:CTP synthase n=1 Tax=Mycoplasma leonicaptivi TaxID=36742 RepID=UPI000485A6FD|nr:CTP synthase [Mycoplasma leonicaptivi]